MNPRRLILALAVALVLSGAATFVISHKLGARTDAKPTTQRVVAAAQAIESGAVLRPQDLKLVDWPASLPLKGQFVKTEDLVGRSVIYPVAQGQPILIDYVAAAGSGIGLTIKIPEGMRATSVRSDEIVGVAGFLYPGSHVDVLVTLRPESGTKPSTQIVLQDVEVLTAGQNIEPDPQGKPQTVNVVTLLLTPQDSQKIVLAASQGSVQFVLRNGSDHGQVKAYPIQLASLGGGEPIQKAPSYHPSVHSEKPQPYVVETIMGDKRMTSRFE